jgi:hypothetical protein
MARLNDNTFFIWVLLFRVLQGGFCGFVLGGIELEIIVNVVLVVAVKDTVRGFLRHGNYPPGLDIPAQAGRLAGLLHYTGLGGF